MQAWHKAVIKDTIKTLVPAKVAVRRTLRRYFPYETDPSNDEGLFESAVRQIELLRGLGLDINRRRVLEIGSGWHPILPMVFLAAGAKSVALTDLDLR